MRYPRSRHVWLAVLLPCLMASGCTSPGGSSSPQQNQSPQAPSIQPAVQVPRLKVVTTFLPVYLFTKAVAGDAAEVSILLPPGTDVHEYQSRPADVKAIVEADVLVKNGLGMEEFLEGTVRNAQNANLKMIDASKGIQPLKTIGTVVNPTEEDGHDHGHAHETEETSEAGKKKHGHSHAAGNPHVWLDPTLAKRQVETIRDGLIQADPKNRAAYEANAQAYLAQLADLDQQFQQRLGKYRDRTFITFHDAFPYLARRYQLNQVAVVEIPEDSLSPADLQETVKAVKQFQVKALLSEPGVDNKLLQTLSRDLKLNLKTLDSLESGNLDPQYYFTAMQANLQTLEAAFQ
ncbi:MAG: metal ABC transporter substrate-binding protein [Leptolyngbyaceae cyanobacterium bins.59]|nr:metal ABC transporter substrate-binding protein [Leptolyngbyaceae cyanobacterium bins.59]